MPLNLNREVFITCAVTGSGSTQDRSQFVPRSPKDIANSAINAAKAGAAIVHCHVRDPETGKPSRNLAYYREVTDRIRDSGVDVVLNLTAGMGGDMVFGGTENPLPVAEGTDMIGAEERVAHIVECLPEICTLDCGTMNFAEADYVMTNTPGMLQAMGSIMTEAGVKPEIEAFDTGHLWYAKQLVADGIIGEDVLVQLCMGVPWGAPDDLNTFMAMVNNVPENWREGTTFLAAAIFAGNCLTLGSDGNEFGPFFFFICLNMVALYAVSEGVIGNIWRYNLLVGGLMGVIFAGAGTFFGYEPPEALMPLQLVLWITFILGLGVGPLLAWRDR